MEFLQQEAEEPTSLWSRTITLPASTATTTTTLTTSTATTLSTCAWPTNSTWRSSTKGTSSGSIESTLRSCGYSRASNQNWGQVVDDEERCDKHMYEEWKRHRSHSPASSSTSLTQPYDHPHLAASGTRKQPPSPSSYDLQASPPAKQPLTTTAPTMQGDQGDDEPMAGCSSGGRDLHALSRGGHGGLRRPTLWSRGGHGGLPRQQQARSSSSSGTGCCSSWAP